jgi:hypothetical protein
VGRIARGFVGGRPWQCRCSTQQVSHGASVRNRAQCTLGEARA